MYLPDLTVLHWAYHLVNLSLSSLIYNKDKQILIHYAIPISSGYVKVNIITLLVESVAENPTTEFKFY